jgi:hypothetical protein
MEFIAKFEASTAVSSFAFTSIPQTYDDLYLVVSVKSSGTTGPYVSNAMRFNGTYTAYQRRVYQAASVVESDAHTNPNELFFGILPNLGSAQNNNLFNSQTIYIPSYRSSNNSKNAWTNGGYTSNNGAGESSFNIYALYTAQTQTGITSVTLLPWDSSNYVQYSSAILYGIKNS